MGHAHHFLSRLDRVSLPQVELALGLYNDAPLLQFVLYSVRLPEGAERVAISLDHPETGPFLVVTREGRFVTCLAQGMSVGDLPVVTRGQLDGLAAKVAVLRARIEECRVLAGPTGGVGKLIRRIHEGADELTREDIVPVLGLAPLYTFEFFHFFVAAGHDLTEARERLVGLLKRSDRLKPQFNDALRSYWNTFWSIGHFAVLAASDGAALLDRLSEPMLEIYEETSLSWPAVRQGVASLALKGAWAVARIGKPFLAATKRRYRTAGSPLTFVDSAMGLAALGLRHAKLQAEVTKTLGGGPEMDPQQPRGRLLHAINDVLRVILERDAADPAEIAEEHRKLGAHVWMAITRGRPRSAPYQFERAEDVPEDVALAAAANAPLNFMSETEAVTPLFMNLPWVARAAPEQLYLPRALMQAARVPWQPENTLRLIRAHRDYYKSAPPKPVGPARQGPCPCGSGKKYKRCCEEEAVEEPG